MSPGVLAASAAGYLRPTAKRSTGLLKTMLAPGHRPRTELVEWMTLVAQHARSSAAPGRVHPSPAAAPTLAVVGEHDTFLPPQRLRPALRSTLDIGLSVVPDAGHLVVDELPDQMADLISDAGEDHPPHEAHTD